jgi:hypothetical protein
MAGLDEHPSRSLKQNCHGSSKKPACSRLEPPIELSAVHPHAKSYDGSLSLENKRNLLASSLAEDYLTFSERRLRTLAISSTARASARFGHGSGVGGGQSSDRRIGNHTRYLAQYVPMGAGRRSSFRSAVRFFASRRWRYHFVRAGESDLYSPRNPACLPAEPGGHR